MSTTHPSPAHSSSSDEWATPPETFAALDQRYGPFTLDACASNGMSKVANHYGLDHSDERRRDALAADWATDAGPGGVVWCNPPYSRGLFADFLRKAAATADAGTRVVLLFPTMKTGNQVFQEVVVPRLDIGTARIEFLAGRLHFTKPDGTTGPAPCPSLVVVLEPCPNPDRVSNPVSPIPPPQPQANAC